MTFGRIESGDVLNPDGETSDPSIDNCPLCDDDIEKLADHLPDCNGGH